jgi:diguanylate cyclase (GGDEF)-like protein
VIEGSAPGGDEGRGAGIRALARRPLGLLLVLLSAIEAARVVVDFRWWDVPVAVVLALIGLVGLRARRADEASDVERASEAEAFARILRGLARSGSPEAIVDAIVQELGATTGASHVAVARRLPEAGYVEAILTATRPGTPQSRTTFPLTELDDPAGTFARSRQALAAAGRRIAVVPIEPDPDGDPHLASLGLAAPDRPRPAGAVAMDRRAAQRVADHLAARLRAAYGLPNLIAAPLRVGGRVEGAIVLARRVEDPWPQSARPFLEAAAVEASGALARLYALRDAEVRATIDSLTGLPNRRYFDEYVSLLARRRRSEDKVGVLMIDLDRFKGLNDTYGHAVGDQVLQEVARAIGTTVRDQDVPARFGGEEFAVLLRNPTPEVAVEVGERIRRAIGQLDLRAIGVPAVSVSVGVAVADRADLPLEAVIEEADRALYRAKRAGRDRVVAA